MRFPLYMVINSYNCFFSIHRIKSEEIRYINYKFQIILIKYHSFKYICTFSQLTGQPLRHLRHVPCIFAHEQNRAKPGGFVFAKCCRRKDKGGQQGGLPEPQIEIKYGNRFIFYQYFILFQI